MYPDDVLDVPPVEPAQDLVRPSIDAPQLDPQSSNVEAGIATSVPDVPAEPVFGETESLSWASDPVPAMAMQPPEVAVVPGPSVWKRMGGEIVAGLQTLVSAAVYATLIVTFGFQVARVDGLSMAPTLEDRDRLSVNKLVYELGDPRPGDIVML